MSIAAEEGASEEGSAMPQQMHQQQMPPQHPQMHQQYQQDAAGYAQQQPDGSCSYGGGAYGHPGAAMGYADPSGGWGMGMGMGMGMGELDDDYGDGHPMAQSMIEGPSVVIPALSFRQPFASLVLYGIKQLEARNRPTLKQMQGPLALHVSHREEPWNSPLLSAAVSLLRRRYPDEQISQSFQLPQTMSQGHGCIVGIVDVECTWHADLFNEVEQHQLTEQAVFPVQGTWVTQLRNPRWLKYPVRTTGSNKLWQVQIPLDALPDGTEVDGSGNLICLATRDRPPLYQPGSCAPLLDGDDMGLGLLGGDMVRQLQSENAQSESEKKRKKLQKALRQIDDLKEKAQQGAKLEKTQQGKIEREHELRAELETLNKQAADAGDAAGDAGIDMSAAIAGIPGL